MSRFSDSYISPDDRKFAIPGRGHYMSRQCDDQAHRGGPVMQQEGGKAIRIAGRVAGWRCPVCVARRAAERAEVAA